MAPPIEPQPTAFEYTLFALLCLAVLIALVFSVVVWYRRQSLRRAAGLTGGFSPQEVAAPEWVEEHGDCAKHPDRMPPSPD